METINSQKTSVFRGVYKDGASWKAVVRRAGFFRRFKTEVEAAAYYNMVAAFTWGDSSRKRLNNLKSVRLDCKTKLTRHGLSTVIYIDKSRYVIVDEDNYETMWVRDWFFDSKTKLCTRLLSVEKVEGIWRFQKITMHEFIFGGPCFHRNQTTIDNRRINLSAVPEDRNPFGKPILPFMEGACQVDRGRSGKS